MPYYNKIIFFLLIFFTFSRKSYFYIILNNKIVSPKYFYKICKSCKDNISTCENHCLKNYYTDNIHTYVEFQNVCPYCEELINSCLHCTSQNTYLLHLCPKCNHTWETEKMLFKHLITNCAHDNDLIIFNNIILLILPDDPENWKHSIKQILTKRKKDK